MGLKERINQELKLRKKYKEFVEKYDDRTFPTYESYKNAQLKHQDILYNNAKIVPLLEEFINSVLKENENLDIHMEKLQDFIEKITNGNHKNGKFTFEKAENDDSLVYKFMYQNSNVWPVFEVEVETDMNNIVTSLSAIYLCTLNYEGATRLLSPTESLKIENINEEEAKVTTAMYPTDFFNRRYNKCLDDAEWQDINVEIVARSDTKKRS